VGSETAPGRLGVFSARFSWVPFFLALVIRGTDIEDEPGHLPRVVGVPVNWWPQH
jgi:hypothetical protein